MTLEERRKMYVSCDICNEEPAEQIKGGNYNNEYKMWFVCKECLNKITDRRKKRDY